MAEFRVKGPFEVPLERRATGGVNIHQAKIQELKSQDPAFDKRGCYVFVLKAPKGDFYTPIYIGQTTKASLLREAFNDRNQNAINLYLNDRPRHRSLFIFLVTQTASKGKPNLSAIGEIEDFLIANAADKNPQLMNKKGIVKERWSIRGVYRADVGKPDNAARRFKQALGI